MAPTPPRARGWDIYPILRPYITRVWGKVGRGRKTCVPPDSQEGGHESDSERMTRYLTVLLRENRVAVGAAGHSGAYSDPVG